MQARAVQAAAATASTIVEAQHRLYDALSTGDLGAIESLIHLDYQAESVPFGGPPIIGRDGFLNQVRTAIKTLFLMGPISVCDLGQDTLLIHAMIRAPLPAGGHTLRTVYWLNTYQDGLLWRTHTVRSEEAARLLQQHC